MIKTGGTRTGEIAASPRRRAEFRKFYKWIAIPFLLMNGACSLDAHSTRNTDEAKQMSDSPMLRDAKSFRGVWRVTGVSATCDISLSEARVEAANAHVLGDSNGCLSRLLGRPVAGWRPAPDGIDFAGADRLSVGFFAFEGQVAVLARPEGRLVLSRVKSS